MNSNMEFDIKHEEDPLMITEIKSEPQDNTFSVKEEPEESKHFDEYVDIKHGINPMSQLDATIKATSEVEKMQENVMKLVEYNEKKSHEQKNTEDEEMNGLLLVHESCVRCGIDLQEDSVCDQTGETVKPLPEFHNFGFCNKEFSVESNYATCIYVGSGKKRYSCNFCTKIFTSKYNVTRHTRTHTKEKPFTCDFCCKSFSQKCNLIIHNRIHTSEKPFTCDICSKSFSQKRDLIIHNHFHTNEKLFKCNICSKLFSQKRNLIIHNRLHTNEKPFTCDFCNKSFSQKRYLIKHNRLHTDEKFFHVSYLQ